LRGSATTVASIRGIRIAPSAMRLENAILTVPQVLTQAMLRHSGCRRRTDAGTPLALNEPRQKKAALVQAIGQTRTDAR
jgi:hypothetical protein